MLLLPFQIVWRVKSLLSRVEPGNHFPEMELTQMERERGEGGGRARENLKMDLWLVWFGYMLAGETQGGCYF